jgi:hypothetical protein
LIKIGLPSSRRADDLDRSKPYTNAPARSTSAASMIFQKPLA